MRISDWSSDVCSSDLILTRNNVAIGLTPEEAENAVRWYRFDSQVEDLQEWMDGLQQRYRTYTERRKRLLAKAGTAAGQGEGMQIGRASCRERVCPYV